MINMITEIANSTMDLRKESNGLGWRAISVSSSVVPSFRKKLFKTASRQISTRDFEFLNVGLGIFNIETETYGVVQLDSE